MSVGVHDSSVSADRASVSNDVNHPVVGASDSNLSSVNSTLGSPLGNLSSSSSHNSNVSISNELLSMGDSIPGASVNVDSSHFVNLSSDSSYSVKGAEARSVGGSDNLEVFVSDLISNTDMSLSFDDDSVMVGVVHDNSVVGIVVMMDDSGLVGDFVETKLLGILHPVSLSGLGDGSTSSVKSCVLAECIGRGGHGFLVLCKLSLLKDSEVLSVGAEFSKDLLLELGTELS